MRGKASRAIGALDGGSRDDDMEAEGLTISHLQPAGRMQSAHDRVGRRCFTGVRAPVREVYRVYRVASSPCRTQRSGRGQDLQGLPALQEEARRAGEVPGVIFASGRQKGLACRTGHSAGTFDVWDGIGWAGSKAAKLCSPLFSGIQD
jgi:hypothetical protein